VYYPASNRNEYQKQENTQLSGWTRIQFGSNMKCNAGYENVFANVWVKSQKVPVQGGARPKGRGDRKEQNICGDRHDRTMGKLHRLLYENTKLHKTP
jgi:hypothetical protein